MTMTTYAIFEEEKADAEIGNYTGYGIEIIGPGISGRIPDVSSNRKRMEDFVAWINRHRLSPVHLRDAIEDYFYCS